MGFKILRPFLLKEKNLRAGAEVGECTSTCTIFSWKVLNAGLNDKFL